MDKSELSAPMRAAVEMLQAKGFTVHMRESKDIYAYYTDGTGIATFEFNHLGGYNLSTVHIPEASVGCGFVVFRDASLAVFERDAAEAFFIVPAWVSRKDFEGVTKFPSWYAFAKYNGWNKGYKAIE